MEKLKWGVKNGHSTYTADDGDLHMISYLIYQSPDYAWVLTRGKEQIAYGREPELALAKDAAERAADDFKSRHTPAQ